MMRNNTHKLQSRRTLLLRKRDSQLQTRFPPREQKKVLRHTLPRNNKLCLLQEQPSLEHPWEVHCSRRELLYIGRTVRLHSKC
jgi:hypothetical protein